MRTYWPRRHRLEPGIDSTNRSEAIEQWHQEQAPLRVRVAQALARARSDISFAIIDALVIGIAYSAALVLRFIDVQGVPVSWLRDFAVAMPFVLAAHVLMNLAFGAYGHVWEFASVEEAMRLVLATVAAATVVVAGILIYRDVTGGPGVMPLTVAVAGALVALGGMGAIRFRTRLFSFKRMIDSPAMRRTLVVGTRRPAAELARHGSSPDQPRNVIGFVSMEDANQIRRLAGRPVLGVFADVGSIVRQSKPDEVVIAEEVTEDDLRRLVDECIDVDVRLRILPNPFQALQSAHLRDIRDLELDDLLPRPSLSSDLTGAEALFSGKRVLVTGAGGSIGAELVCQLLDLSAKVIALDHDETHLHDAMLTWPQGGDVELVLCDIRDESDVIRNFEELQPEIVFHAAALKHVPILERYPYQAVRTNVLGTANVLSAAEKESVSHFVLISTDKAVNPENVLGTTKRIAEMLVQAAGSTESNTNYASVRFGNVLGSRGSVVPTFMDQIRRGGPVTVTDPEMTRYFMTVEEAVGLVLQAAAMADRGEVFVLDMGKPARILDLAHRMIRLAGLVPNRDIEVSITGPRPGEKKVESLSVGPLSPSRHPRIGVATAPSPEAPLIAGMMEMLVREADSGHRPRIAALLHEMAWKRWDPGAIVDLTEIEELGTWA